jgi:cytochrome c oxidase cbb3-type subunit 3
MENKRIDEPTGTETVGHEWDGIEELDTPMPRWWLWTFYLCIIFSIGYVIVYPAIPLLDRGTEGLWGWTSRGQLAKELRLAEESHAEVRERIAQVPIERLVRRSRADGRGGCGRQGGVQGQLRAVPWFGRGGRRWLSQPQRRRLAVGRRSQGDRIHARPRHSPAWRQADARQSQMPAFAGAWTPVQLGAVTDHVLSLSGKAKSNPVGAQLYAENCVACHGAAGQGDKACRAHPRSTMRSGFMAAAAPRSRTRS